MERRSRATVVLATLAALLVATAGPCGAQEEGPPSECVPECKEDGRQGIPCENWCEWYVDCKDGVATPTKCGTSWWKQMYFDNTKRDCRLSIWPWTVDCDWWKQVTTVAPTPPTTTSPATPSTVPSTEPTTTPSTAHTTNPSTEPTTTSPARSSIAPSTPSTTSPHPINPTTNPTSSSSESTKPSASTTLSPGESTSSSSSESTTSSSRESTTYSPSESTTSGSTKPGHDSVPTPSSAGRASAALSTFLLAVGLAVL